jgi:hypothetical protein
MPADPAETRSPHQNGGRPLGARAGVGRTNSPGIGATIHGGHADAWPPHGAMRPGAAGTIRVHHQHHEAGVHLTPALHLRADELYASTSRRLPLRYSARQVQALVRCRPCPRNQPSRGAHTRTVGGLLGARAEVARTIIPIRRSNHPRRRRRGPAASRRCATPSRRSLPSPPSRTSSGSAPNARASPAGDECTIPQLDGFLQKYSARQVQALVRRQGAIDAPSIGSGRRW